MWFNLTTLFIIGSAGYFWWFGYITQLKWLLIGYGVFFGVIFIYSFIETTFDQIKDIKIGQYNSNIKKKYLKRWL